MRDTSTIERALLSLLLYKPRSLLDTDVETEHFADPRHRIILQVIAEEALRDGKTAVDLVVIHDRARALGCELTYTDLAEIVALHAVDVRDLTATLRAVWTQNAIEERARLLVDQLQEPDAVAAECGASAIEDMTAILRGAEATLHGYPAMLAHRRNAVRAGTQVAELVTSGFQSIDLACGGFPRGGLVIVGGRPGRGKSALLQQICEATARAGNRALLCSPEMAGYEIADRGLARACRIDLRDIRYGTLTPDETRRLDAFHPGPDGVLVYDAPRQTSRDVAQTAQRAALAGPLTLVAVDYLQFLADKRQAGEARYELVGRMGRRMKELARSIHAAVVVGAQLKREGDERSPHLADLRESGDLEQDADLVLLLDAPGDDGLVTIHVAKNRQGPTGVTQLEWCAKWTAFSDPGPVWRRA